jgi:hypothetical protein
MSSCEKCWRDAGGDAEKYHQLVKERNAAGMQCTPEEQAGGEYATACPSCGRKTVHMHSGQCMNQECQREPMSIDDEHVPSDAVMIEPQPMWIRPASGGTEVWHGYCGSGPPDGLKCPFGVNGKPEEIAGVWYWVRAERKGTDE